MLNSGETVALRGVYKQWVCYTQSARVIKDVPKETVLLVEPGAECADFICKQMIVNKMRKQSGSISCQIGRVDQ